MAKKKSMYWIGKTFSVANKKLRITDIYSCSWWKQDLIALDIDRDGEWIDYKMVDLIKIKKYL